MFPPGFQAPVAVSLHPHPKERLRSEDFVVKPASALLLAKSTGANAQEMGRVR